MKTLLIKPLRFILLLFVLLSAISSCEKIEFHYAPPTLPPATQEGKNTMGFLFNGRVWEPESSISYSARLNYDSKMGEYVSIFGVGQVADLEVNLGMNIRTYSTLRVGKSYSLTNNDTASAEIYVYNGKEFRCEYNKDDVLDGELLITYYDDQRKILAGTF